MDPHTRPSRSVFADENGVPAAKSLPTNRRLPLQPIHPNVPLELRSSQASFYPQQSGQASEAGTQTSSPPNADAEVDINSDATIDDAISPCDEDFYHDDMHQRNLQDVNALHEVQVQHVEVDHVEDHSSNGQIFESTATSQIQTTPLSLASTPSEVTSMRSMQSAHMSENIDDLPEYAGEVTQLRIALQSVPVHQCNPLALFPYDNQHHYLLREQCAQIVFSTPGLLDQEDEDTWDASMAAEYSEDIFEHMRIMELKLLPNSGYMAHQTEVTWQIRAMLVDWLVSVHFKFNLLPETLFLCVNYIDRFLSVKAINLSRIQLVGAVALLMATKFEEINYLSIQEVCQIVDNRYTVEEIKAAERYMFDRLEFNLGFPGPMSFLRRVSKADDYDIETRTLAKYLLEITVMDEKFVGAPPSWCAAIAHYMARHMLRKGSWTARHVFFSNYTEGQLLSGVKAVRDALNDPNQHHKAVFEKYSERKFRKAAVFVKNWVALVTSNPTLDFDFV